MIGDDYGFLSDRWTGIKSISELNGDRRKYRNVYVDLIDLRTKRKVGRMALGAALRKFQ